MASMLGTASRWRLDPRLRGDDGGGGRVGAGARGCGVGSVRPVGVGDDRLSQGGARAAGPAVVRTRGAFGVASRVRAGRGAVGPQSLDPPYENRWGRKKAGVPGDAG